MLDVIISIVAYQFCRRTTIVWYLLLGFIILCHKSMVARLYSDLRHAERAHLWDLVFYQITIL